MSPILVCSKTFVSLVAGVAEGDGVAVGVAEGAGVAVGVGVGVGLELFIDCANT
jgi:hypothetical protein